MARLSIASALILIFSFGASASDLIKGVYRGPGFERPIFKQTSQSMGYTKSVQYRIAPNIPLGGGLSMLAVRGLSELKAKNVVIEARGTMEKNNDERISFGPYNGGVDWGFMNLLSAVHAAHMTSSLKLVLVEGDGETYHKPTPRNKSRFWESYIRYAARYAKIAQKANASEIILATNLTDLICSSVESDMGFKGLIDTVRYYYSGRLRIDASSFPDVLYLNDCLGESGGNIDAYGIDVGVDPTVNQVLAHMADVLLAKHALKVPIILSHVSFRGADQKEKTEKLVQTLESLALSGEFVNMTLGLVDINPDRSLPTDTSENMLGKPALEVVKKWFSEF